MKAHLKSLLGTMVMILGMASEAFATDAVSVLNLEGNPSCSSLAINTILDIKDTSPPSPGFSETVTGPDGQTIEYTRGGTDSLSEWHITSMTNILPVNFVILKAQGNAGARVFHYGNGVISDTNLVATGSITQVTFCYGLSLSEPPEEQVDCEALTGEGGLAGTEIDCPPTGKRVIYSFDPNSANWNVQSCTCNTTFTECNPESPAGAADACVGGTPLPHVPVIVEAVEDPFVCTTQGGRRDCSTCVDANPSLAGCQ